MDGWNTTGLHVTSALETTWGAAPESGYSPLLAAAPGYSVALARDTRRVASLGEPGPGAALEIGSSLAGEASFHVTPATAATLLGWAVDRSSAGELASRTLIVRMPIETVRHTGLKVARLALEIAADAPFLTARLSLVGRAETVVADPGVPEYPAGLAYHFGRSIVTVAGAEEQAPGRLRIVVENVLDLGPMGDDGFMRYLIAARRRVRAEVQTIEREDAYAELLRTNEAVTLSAHFDHPAEGASALALAIPCARCGRIERRTRPDRSTIATAFFEAERSGGGGAEITYELV